MDKDPSTYKISSQLEPPGQPVGGSAGEIKSQLHTYSLLERECSMVARVFARALKIITRGGSCGSRVHNKANSDAKGIHCQAVCHCHL